jgi:anti-sigma regulatory factor (Ser/Thr protein kinase)
MTAMREGGLGLFIIEKSVDTVRYFATETGRKCIQMIKRIR